MFEIRRHAVILVFLILLSSIWFGPRPAWGAQNDSVPARVGLNPPSISSLSLQPPSTVTFDVNVTDAQPFAGFIIGIFFNNTILRFQSIDYSGGVLGNNAFLSTLCVDGYGSQCLPDIRFDGPGVVSLALGTSSGLNTTTPNGKLFSVTFNVVAQGLSPIHFVQHVLGTSPDGTLLPDVAFDGYFTNIECPSGSGNLCKLPIVSFTPPIEVVSNQPEFFQGDAVSQNPSGVITEYNWTWISGFDRQYYNSPPPGTATPSPNATLIFRVVGGENEVTLSAQDNYGTRAYYSLSILLVRSHIDVLGFFTDASLNPLPFYHGDARVDVVLSNGMVRSTNPRHVLAWVNITNTGAVPLQSLFLGETLPFDWAVSPSWMPGSGSIHVYYANTTSLTTNADITDPSAITITIDRIHQQHVVLSIPSLNATGIGHPLFPGQSILISVKLSYSLVKTSQSATTYPRTYVDNAAATAWSQPSYTGSEGGEGFLMCFVAFPQVVGNTNRLIR